MRDAEMWRTLKPFQPSRIRLERLDQRQRRAERAGRQARPAPTITAGRSALANASVDRLRKLAEQLEIVADPLDLHAEVDFRARSRTPCRPCARPCAAACAISGASQRMLEPTSSTASAFSIPAMVELNATAARLDDVVGQARLPPFEQRRPLPFEQLLRRIHRLGVEQVAGDRRDLAPGLLQPLGEQLERFAASSLRAACPSRAPTAGRAGCAPAHRHGGASCR